MKVLVTGGAGFIGSNFVHLTLATRPDVGAIFVTEGPAGTPPRVQTLNLTDDDFLATPAAGDLAASR